MDRCMLPSRLVVGVLVVALGASSGAAPLNVLVFSRTTGFRHASIPTARAAIHDLGERLGFEMTVTEDPTVFTAESLAAFDVAVFLHATEAAGNPLLAPSQRTAFEQFIGAGNGFVGIHAASDVTNDWPWYLALVGGRFLQHPSVQQATIEVVDATHASTHHLDSTWVRVDEWYDFQQLSPTLEVLLQLDESSYTGGSMGNFHPISWKHQFDGGRSWYTGMGHTDNSYAEPDFLLHLAGGILWAGGATGDFNDDGRSDLADYTVWRDHRGGVYSAEDFEVWKLFFGTASPAPQPLHRATAVPEPAPMPPLLLAGGFLFYARRMGIDRNRLPVAA